MILTGPQIESEVKSGRIVIDPFNPACINPNSYNFCLGKRLYVYTDKVIDTKYTPTLAAIDMTEEGFVLEPEQMYLASTVERLGSEFYVPMYAARSSVARLGMFINLSAPLGDIGFIGQWTLQLLAKNRVRIYPGMRIGQMTFWKTLGKIDLYRGRYQNAVGPLASRIHYDFRKGQNISGE